MADQDGVNFTLSEATMESFSLRLHMNTVVSVLANLTALYLIVHHSSKAISDYKWCLFNITLTFMLFDLHMTLVFQPLLLYPTPVVCTVGIARYLPPFYNTVFMLLVTTVLFGCCIGSLFTAFLFRLLTIYGWAKIMRHPLVIAALAFVHLTATAPSVWAFSLAFRPIGDTNTESYSCMIRESTVGSYTMGAEAAFWTVELFCQPVLTFWKLQSERRRISIDTYKAQRALLFSLSVQVFLPLVTMALPIIAVVASNHLNFVNTSTIVQVAMQMLTLHSFMNAFALIALTKPYRDKVLRFLSFSKARHSAALATNLAYWLWGLAHYLVCATIVLANLVAFLLSENLRIIDKIWPCMLLSCVAVGGTTAVFAYWQYTSLQELSIVLYSLLLNAYVTVCCSLLGRDWLLTCICRRRSRVAGMRVDVDTLDELLTADNQTVRLDHIPAGATNCDIVDFFGLLTHDGSLPAWRVVLFILEVTIIVSSFALAAGFVYLLYVTTSVTHGFKGLSCNIAFATLGSGLCRLAVIYKTFTSNGLVPFDFMWRTISTRNLFFYMVTMNHLVMLLQLTAEVIRIRQNYSPDNWFITAFMFVLPWFLAALMNYCLITSGAGPMATFGTIAGAMAANWLCLTAAYCLTRKCYRQVKAGHVNQKYCLASNIRTVRCVRALTALTVVRDLVQPIMVAVVLFYMMPKCDIDDYRVFTHCFDLVEATYGLLSPLAIMLSHSSLRTQIRQRLMRRRVAEWKAPTNVFGEVVPMDNTQATHFALLQESWSK